MTQFIDIVEIENQKDSQGFSNPVDIVRASVRAFKEDRRGTETWRNRAVFSNANALFRFRAIPGLPVTSAMWIVCGGERYDIRHVEDVSNRGMYVEILAEKYEPSKGGGANGKSFDQTTG
jgi:hypothetical protein